MDSIFFCVLMRFLGKIFLMRCDLGCDEIAIPGILAVLSEN